MNKRIIHLISLLMLLFLLTPSAQAAGGVKAPTASVKSGSYTASQSVKFKSKTKGATLYYTTNGSAPTTKSKKYTGKKITVSKTSTFKVIAIKGKKKSKVLTAVYTILTEPKLKSVENTANGVSVSWNAVSGAEGYQVYRKEGNGSWKALAKTKAVSYVDKTAQAGKTYSYSVSAYKGKTYGKYNTKGISCKAAHIHSYSQWSTIKPTCTENGEKTRACLTCGKKESISLSSTGHKREESIVTAPSCTENGLKNRVCSVCGDSEEISIPSAGHKWKEAVISAPSCTEDGVKSQICSVCGVTESSPIPASGHTWKENVFSSATCVTDGSKGKLCMICGASESSPIPALGHDWRESVVKSASCETAGEKKLTCSRCSTFKSESIPAVGHKWSKAVTTASTCAEQGSTVKTCSTCGKMDRVLLPVVDHEYETQLIDDDACRWGFYDWEFCKWCGVEKTYTFDEVELYYYEDLSHQLFDELLDYRQEYYESVGGKGERRKIVWNEASSQQARLQAAYNALCVCMKREAHRESYINGGEWNPAFHSGGEDGSAASYYRTASEILQSWKDSHGHNNDILSLASGTRKFTGETYNPDDDIKTGAMAIYACNVNGRMWWVAIFCTTEEYDIYSESQNFGTFIVNSPDGQKYFEPLETYATREQMLNCPKTINSYPFKN